MQKSYLIDIENLNLAIQKVKTLQTEADAVTEESADWEIRTAYNKYQQALGHMGCLATLGQLTPAEYEELSTLQMQIGEKLAMLQDERRGKIFVTGEARTRVLKSAKSWQKQADSASEKSNNAELTEAFVDWGITQGYLNCMRLSDIAPLGPYEEVSKKQQHIRNKLGELQERKRTPGTANTTESA